MKKWQNLQGFCDGAARGNPGPAGAGGVIVDVDSGETKKLKKFLGKATNNVAEYEGCLLVLEHAVELGCENLTLHADSELMIKQLTGEYRVKAEHLIPLHAKALKLLSKIKKTRLTHIPRAKNKEADLMSNLAIDDP